MALHPYNLDQQLHHLLLANYDHDPHDETDGLQEREAVDVLQDSARVAHHVAGLLSNYESQRKFSPSLMPVPGTPDTVFNPNALETSVSFPIN